jgi:uncharacterized protein (DUF983 family)
MELKPSKAAEEALERLGMAVGTIASTMYGATYAAEQSDHGDDTLLICPHCGAGNDVFSQRCSRCHGDFGKQERSDFPEEVTARLSRSVLLVFLGSFLAIAGLAAAVFYWVSTNR